MKTAPFLAALAALSLGILTVGCDPNKATTDTATTTASPGASSPAKGSMTIAVIPKGLTHVFWQSVKAGAEKSRKRGRGDHQVGRPAKRGRCVRTSWHRGKPN